jgi:hypothetical protein
MAGSVMVIQMKGRMVVNLAETANRIARRQPEDPSHRLFLKGALKIRLIPRTEEVTPGPSALLLT